MSQIRMKFIISILTLVWLTLSSTVGWAVMSKGLKSIPIELKFESFVESPSHISLCNGNLWAFSESSQKLIAINSKDGKILKQFAIPGVAAGVDATDVAAMTCQNSRLYLLVNAIPEGRIIEIQAKLDDFKTTNQFGLPQKSRATDLFCNNSQCWLLQDQPLMTVNFRKWQKNWVPFPLELKKVYAHPELDPFEDWQRSLVLAKGKYTKGAIDSHNQYVFMDPFHAQAVIRTGAEFVKWGSFGAWEGSFLSPKALTFVRENILAVADTKLKAVFIFRRDGVYLGVLAWGPQMVFSPDYPLGMVADGSRLYVADFRANKIFAVDIKEYKSNLEDIEPLTIRQNLFRREEVLKDGPSSLCLNCHDGTVSNHLHKFVKMSFHHPLECSQCHDPHHKVKSRKYLRDQPENLCLPCHKDYADKKTNHVGFDHNKKGSKCNDCHQSHANSEKLLVMPKPDLCVSCHKENSFNHKSVEDISILNKAKDVYTDGGKISCQTCHETHINWKETHFIKDPNKIVPFCSSCHGEKSPHLFKEFHKAVKLKRGHK